MLGNAGSQILEALVAGGAPSGAPDWQQKSYVEMKLAQQAAEQQGAALQYERDQLQGRENMALQRLGAVATGAQTAVRSLPIMGTLVYTLGTVSLFYIAWRLYKGFKAA